jgi:hypothetical protein
LNPRGVDPHRLSRPAPSQARRPRLPLLYPSSYGFKRLRLGVFKSSVVLLAFSASATVSIACVVSANVIPNHGTHMEIPF